MTETPSDPGRLLRRAERERRARKEAERLLEEKSLELYEANQALQRQAAALEEQVRARTAELNAALERAEEAVRAKSDFLAVMSHEIRTPLNAVIGMAELLSLESLAPEHQEQVSLIHDNGRNLLALINDILDFSKIEAGKLQIEQELFDPTELLQGTVRSFEAQHAPQRVRLRTQLAPLPKWVIGDRLRLRQVLANLIGNAVKFSPHGEVRLEADADETADGWRLHVRVADSGIGMTRVVLDLSGEARARLLRRVLNVAIDSITPPKRVPANRFKKGRHGASRRGCGSSPGTPARDPSSNARVAAHRVHQRVIPARAGASRWTENAADSAPG
jgi:signal transduction histidine kinase